MGRPPAARARRLYPRARTVGYPRIGELQLAASLDRRSDGFRQEAGDEAEEQQAAPRAVDGHPAAGNAAHGGGASKQTLMRTRTSVSTMARVLHLTAKPPRLAARMMSPLPKRQQRPKKQQQQQQQQPQPAVAAEHGGAGATPQPLTLTPKLLLRLVSPALAPNTKQLPAPSKPHQLPLDVAAVGRGRGARGRGPGPASSAPADVGASLPGEATAGAGPPAATQAAACCCTVLLAKPL